MPITQVLLTASKNEPTIAWNSIDYTTVNEGQQNTVYLDFTNWDNTTVYWYLVDANDNEITGQTSSANAGTFSPGTGTYLNYSSFNFTFANDSTTDGELTYYIRIENEFGQLLVPRQGAFTVNDTSFAIGGTLSVNGTSFNWTTTNAASPTYAAYTFPNNTSGSVHTLTGTQYVLSPQFGVAPTLNFNLWFYPTANNTIILGELGQTTENSNWHLTLLEINSSNKLKGRIWEMLSGVTSTGSVNLNAWNHVYFYYDHGTTTFGMSLNNETPVTQGSVTRHVSDTGATFWGIGLYDPGTNMGSSARYQGKFDGLVINTSIVGSNYESTKSKFGL
jgi:hypothetical protein